MKLKLVVLSLCLLVCFIVSCKRNNDNEFFIGKLDGTKIFSRNYILYAENIGVDQLRLNIDDNWSAEVLIESFCYQSNFGDTIRGLQFEGLHKTKIHTTIFYDSVYLHIERDTSFDSQSGKIIIKEITTRTNTKLSEEDEFYCIGQAKYASRLNYGDKIEFIEFEMEQAEVFNSGINSYKDSIAMDLGDTIYCWIEKKEYFEHYPENEMFYIGISSDFKLGWVKVKLEDKNKLTILESCL